MNIVYFLSQFPKTSESFILNEVHELAKRGHVVSIFSLKRPETKVMHQEYYEVDPEVTYLPHPSIKSKKWLDFSELPNLGMAYTSLMNTSIKKTLGNIYIQEHFENYLREQNPDVVYTHFANWPKLAAQKTANRLDIPFVITTHAHGLFKNGGPITKEILINSDRVVTISEFNKRYIRNNYMSFGNIDVVRMGIRKEKFHPSGSIIDGRILCVGRFVEKKGITYGLAAFAEVVKQHSNSELHLVGDGPREHEIKEKINELDIKENVKMLGKVPDKTLITEFDKADVFLLPCIRAADGDMDGIPVTLMEAMLMKTIPVSTTISGIPELITSKDTGFLANPRDVKSLVEALQNSLTHDDRADIRKKAHKKVLASHTSSQTIDSLVESLSEARKSYE